VFIEEYLQDLRRDRFSLPAVIVYLRRATGRLREHLDANPGGVRSVWLVAIGFFAAAFLTAVAMSLAFDHRLAYDFFLRTSLGILPVFALVTLHIGLLRDREGYRLSALNLPTALTLLRISLAPAIVLFLVRRQYPLALAAYVVAGTSDIADGWLARRWGQITQLGTVLDPIVDIVFNLAVFAGLAAAGLVPVWVCAIAGLRYGVLLAGGIALYLFVGPVKIQPTAFGRLTGIFVSSLVALLVVLHIVEGGLGERLAPLTVAALGVLMFATVVQVVALGWYNLRVMTGRARAEGRVIDDVRWGAR